MAERPRPRPRPRPTQRSSTTTATSSSLATSFEAGSSSSVARSNSTTIPLSNPNGSAKRVIVVEDTDEMFMRNRNRSSKTWQKLGQLDRQIEITEVSGSEDDEDENLTPRRRKRAKAGSNVVPAWQKSQELTRMLSQDLSDSSDDDDSNDIVDITPSRQRQGKRKRPRSRSKSITPPPALPAHHIQNAKRIVRQTLEATLPVRPPSPTAVELDPDDSNLQPEFMALVQRVRNESRSGSTQTMPDGIPGEELLLIVNWHPHPLATDATQEEWQYKVDKTDSFRDLFEAVAEDAGVQQANVILTYQGKRFYPSVTPHILKIWSDTAIFNAYEKTAYTYIQTNQQKAVFSQPLASPGFKAGGTSNEPIDINTDSEDDIPYIPRGSTSTFRASTPPHSQPLDSDSDSTTKNLGKTLKLVLRSALTGSKEITLTVRTTTRCDAVVKAFIKKAGLGEDKYPELFAAANGGMVSRKGRKSIVGSGKHPQLSVDGDKFGNDTQIGQTDLEDGDMVEVLGL